MDATIAAALISGGVGALGIVGTVVTSMVGSKNTRQATERTVEAGTANTQTTLTAAHAAWLREKRAAVYEETLMEFQQRQARRSFETTTFDWNTMTGLTPESPVIPQDPRGWPGVHARLVAYATDEVLEIFRVMNGAEVKVQEAHADLTRVMQRFRLAKESGRAEDAPDKSELVAVNKRLNQASATAEAVREHMIEVIRVGLRSQPEAAMPPAEVPAVHRGLLRRR